MPHTTKTNLARKKCVNMQFVYPWSTKELQEHVQKCLRTPGSNRHLKILAFEEGEPENLEENLSEKSREPTTNSTHK